MKLKLIFLTLFISIFIVSYDWQRYTDFSQETIVFIRHLNHLASLVGFIFMFYMFVFSTKIKLLEKNIGLDKMLHIHRYLGIVTVTLLIIHPLLLFLFEFIQYDQLRMFWARWVGLTALIIIILTAVTAVYFKKFKMKYESWKLIHFTNYFAFPIALVHVFFNSNSTTLTHYLWILYGITFVLVVAGKLFNILKFRRSPYTLVKTTKENDEVWTMEFKGKPITYLPGQFLHVQLEDWHNILQSNPFTISSSPVSEIISITPKELGDFTSHIKNLKPGEKAYIDAPYGVFSYLQYPGHSYVFIAGGIGITPFISMLRHMKANNDLNNKICLLWGNQSESELVFREELEGYESEFKFFKIVLIMSDQEDWSGEKGFIDQKILKKYIEEPHQHMYFICGPLTMQKTVKKHLKEMGVKKNKIKHEMFDF